MAASPGSAVGDRDGNSTRSMDIPFLGMTVTPSGKVAAGRIGEVMTGVDPNGMAARHDFKEGDAIFEVAGNSVANPNDVRDAIKNALHTWLFPLRPD